MQSVKELESNTSIWKGTQLRMTSGGRNMLEVESTAGVIFLLGTRECD
jgi:hypothetical protein